MSSAAERMADAAQAKAAMDRWLGPAMHVLRADYMSKLIDVASKPLTADGRAAMEKLAVAIKVLDGVQAQINAVVVDGDIARHAHQYSEQIARIPAERRKILGMSV